MPKITLITAADIHAASFDTLVDVRAPLEFAADHIPGAMNCPVLNDAERAQVGTMYKQTSPFAARKLGAVLTARNIAAAIETHFLDRPKDWRPCVYCWRGGQRSGAMATVLAEIGFSVARLEGGYKSWRHYLLSDLDRLIAPLMFRVIDGKTGAGKTLLLSCLRDTGAQVLDLEALAGHKGSVMGASLGLSPPTQQQFDRDLWLTLRAFDPTRPIWVEAEGKRIGNIHLPLALMNRLRQGERIIIDPPCEARLNYLQTDYADLIARPDQILQRLTALRPYHPRSDIEAWQKMVADAAWPDLIAALLVHHYDPLYNRTMARAGGAAQATYTATPIDRPTYQALAQELEPNGRQTPPPERGREGRG